MNTTELQLRDKFAKAALIGLLSASTDANAAYIRKNHTALKILAKDCYKIANEMIVARSQTPAEW